MHYFISITRTAPAGTSSVTFLAVRHVPQFRLGRCRPAGGEHDWPRLPLSSELPTRQ